MSNAIEYGWGIRILRQDLWEMIISFIISQRKSIPAIRSSIESLCQAYGEDIVVGDVNFKAFPKAEALSRLSLDDLKAHGVGYRDKYILAAANDVVAGRLDLDKLSNMDEEEARAALLDLFGVGIKVANCVLLFALHHVDSFPIDVWIQRVIDQEYGGQFPIEQYSGFAGIVQQYMFYYGRGR